MAERRYSEREENLTEFRGNPAPDYQPWRIIYPRGDRSRLSIAMVMDYEEDEWDIASHEHFVYEFDARDYARELAAENNLAADGPAYLD